VILKVISVSANTPEKQYLSVCHICSKLQFIYYTLCLLW